MADGETGQGCSEDRLIDERPSERALLAEQYDRRAPAIEQEARFLVWMRVQERREAAWEDADGGVTGERAAGG